MRSFLLSAIFFLVFSVGYSQTSVSSANDDVLIRRAMASKYLKENLYDYKSGIAKATHNIILDAFQRSSAIISVDYSRITDAGDLANIQSLVEGLYLIVSVTPTWEQLIELETNQVLFEDRAMHRIPALQENKQ